MKKKYILLPIFAATFFCACEVDVLDKRPLDVIDEQLVWTDVTSAQLYVNGLYNSIEINVQPWWFEPLGGGLIFNMDNISDIIYGNLQGWDWEQYNNGAINADNDPFGKWWYYSPIRNANLFLDHSDQLTGDQEAINTLIGEARFLRAYFYYYLVSWYGGVPLIEHAQDLTDDLLVERNTVDECVAFITDELDIAASLLPPSWGDSEVGRATKGAALALKARMLLYAASPLFNPSNDPAKWQKASDAAKAVIDLSEYSLYPEFGDLFLDDNNEEVIFDKQYAYPYTVNSMFGSEEIANGAYVIDPDGYQMSAPTQDYVDMFEMNSGKPITDPTSGYDPQDPYADRDPRFYGTVLYNGAPWRDATVDTYEGGKNGPGELNQMGNSPVMTGYFLRKYNDPSIPLLYLVDNTQANFILMRYAEIFLNYAEAEIALGNEDEARTYINRVRDRVGMPPTDATGIALINLYRNERAVEFGGEQHRYMDLRRWKIAEEVLNRTTRKMSVTKENDGSFIYEVEDNILLSFPERMYWGPIPLEEIRKNPNLEQNPLY